MRYGSRRRVRQLALVMVAAPAAVWALEQAARRAEARDKASLAGRRLRHGADLVQRFAVCALPIGLRPSWRERCARQQVAGHLGDLPAC